MGWASGSSLAEEMWHDLRDYIPTQNRKAAARIVIDRFEDMDCDTIDECEELVTDAGLEDKYWPDEEDE